MRPQTWYDEYRQYRLETHTVASWLLRKAHDTGLDYERYLKKPRDGSSATGDQQILKLKGFNPLAKQLRYLRPDELKHITPILDSVIHLRREVHGSVEYVGDEVSYRHHLKTITMLKCVRSILRRRDQPLSEATRDHTGKDEKVDKELTGRAIKRNTKSGLNVVAEESPNDEAWLVTSLIFTVMTRLREVVITTRSDYRQEHADLMDASAVTATVMDVVSHLEDEAVKLFPSLDLPDFMDRLRKNSSDDGFRNVYEPIVKVFYLIHLVLELKTQICKKSLITVLEGASSLGDFVLQLVTLFMAQGRPAWRIWQMMARMTQEQLILSDAISDILPVVELLLPPEQDDAFFRCVRNFVKTSKITMSTAFAGRVYLDIHNVLGAQVSSGLSQLQEFGRGIGMCTVTAVQHPNLTSYIDISLVESTVVQIRNSHAELSKDRQAIMAQRIDYKRLRQAVGNHNILRHHPMRCGLLIMKLRDIYQRAALKLIDRANVAIPMAHLYNRLSEENLLVHPWSKMNQLLLIQNESNIFVGPLPICEDDCLKRYCLALGLSTRSFPKDLPKDVVLPKARKVELLAPATRLFSKRFLTTSIPMTEHDIRKILDSPHAAKTSMPTAFSITETFESLRESLNTEKPAVCFDYLDFLLDCVDKLQAVGNSLAANLHSSPCERPMTLVAKVLGASNDSEGQHLLHRAADSLNRCLKDEPQRSAAEKDL